MGWWKVAEDTLVGDEPLDTLSDGIAAIVGQYQAAFGRHPTRAEWEALLQAALGQDLERGGADDGVAVEIRITARPHGTRSSE